MGCVCHQNLRNESSEELHLPNTKQHLKNKTEESVSNVKSVKTATDFSSITSNYIKEENNQSKAIEGIQRSKTSELCIKNQDADTSTKYDSETIRTFDMHNSSYLKIKEGLFDFYSSSKNLFYVLNEIRMNPHYYFDTLKKHFELIKEDKVTNRAYITYESNKQGLKYYFHSSYEKITASFNYFQFLADKKMSYEPLLWSEKSFQVVYSTTQELALHKDKSKFQNDGVGIKKKVVGKGIEYHKNCDFYESILFDVENVDLIPSILILENDESEITTLLTTNFDGAAVMCGNIFSVSYVVFSFYKKTQKTKIKKNKSIKELSLDHPIFSSLDYLNDIVSGDFRIEENIVKAKFLLSDGTLKEEELPIFD